MCVTLTKVPEIPEKIDERKIIVYKSSIDPAIMKLIVEKMKIELFVKGSSKTEPKEIKVVSVDKYYEPYLLLDAKYNIDYFKKRVHILDVDKGTKEVKILGKACKPETVVGREGESRRVIKLEAEEFFSYEDKAFVILDKRGREIPLEQVPTAPSESHPQKILKEFSKKVGKLEIPPQKEIGMIKARIVKRPLAVDKIENELFQISEHLTYRPIYNIKFRNIETGEEKAIKIDGVTARIKTDGLEN